MTEQDCRELLEGWAPPPAFDPDLLHLRELSRFPNNYTMLITTPNGDGGRFQQFFDQARQAEQEGPWKAVILPQENPDGNPD